MPGARHSHSAAVYNQEIIVSGGLTESETALSDVYVVQILVFLLWKRVDDCSRIYSTICTDARQQEGCSLGESGFSTCY